MNTPSSIYMVEAEHFRMINYSISRTRLAVYIARLFKLNFKFE